MKIYSKLTNIAAHLLTSCTKIPVDCDDFKTKRISVRTAVEFSAKVQDNLRSVAVDIINIRDSISKAEYKDHEFCKDVGCLWENCATEPKYCVYTAKDFHKWLKSNGYRILKVGE